MSEPITTPERPTPETDAAEFFVATTPKLSPDEGEMHVSSFFARRLERERDEAGEALLLLRDHQNGCPLPKYQTEWDRAMAMAERILTTMNSEPLKP